MDEMFPTRPWLASPPPPNNNEEGTRRERRRPDSAAAAAAAAAVRKEEKGTPRRRGDDMTWSACDWGGLPLHWSEENDLPPIRDRPLTLQIDDNISADYDDSDNCIAWNPDLTLGQARETSHVLHALKEAQHIRRKNGVATTPASSSDDGGQPSSSSSLMSPFVRAAATSLPTSQQGYFQRHRWGSYIFLFFLLVSVVTFTVILTLGEEVKFLPGYIYFEHYTPIVYASSVFSLGLFAQFLM